MLWKNAFWGRFVVYMHLVHDAVELHDIVLLMKFTVLGFNELLRNFFLSKWMAINCHFNGRLSQVS